MPISKARISSPLEAGTSILDAKQLPSELTSALEYVSERLARKQLHLSLIVIQKDAQLPISPPQSPPLQSSNSVVTSPARSLFSSASSTITRTLSKHSSNGSLASSNSPGSFSRTQYPSLPSSPKPSSPSGSSFSSSSSECSSPSTPATPNPYGLSLMHATTLTPRAEKILRQTINKAEKKFGIGSNWLSSQPLSTSTSCPMIADLIHRSLLQNEILFTSSGLTLVSLDHLYTFKSSLNTYSRTLSPSTLSMAVDELRRLVLSQQGRLISKSYLMTAYSWLGVSLSALVDVNEGYKVAYGGFERISGIEIQGLERPSPPPMIRTDFSRPTPRKPIATRPSLSIKKIDNPSTSSSSLVEFGESAKGPDYEVSPSREKFFGGGAPAGRFGGLGIVTDMTSFREDRGPHLRGPVTPNRREDVTPVTKGEWSFLLVGMDARTAAVETC